MIDHILNPMKTFAAQSCQDTGIMKVMVVKVMIGTGFHRATEIAGMALRTSMRMDITTTSTRAQLEIKTTPQGDINTQDLHDMSEVSSNKLSWLMCEVKVLVHSPYTRYAWLKAPETSVCNRVGLATPGHLVYCLPIIRFLYVAVNHLRSLT